MSDLNSILADLAAGRIDAAEAARRIDGLKAATPAPPEPSSSTATQDDAVHETAHRETAPSETAPSETAPSETAHSESAHSESAHSEADSDPVADRVDESGGRPQFATHTRESFRTPAQSAASSADSTEAQSTAPAGDASEAPTSPRRSDGAEVDPDEVPDSGPTAATTPPKGSKGVDRVTIRSVGRRVRVIGDSSVATLSATGPHVLRRSGRVIEVTSDGDIGPSLDSFSVINPPRSVEDLRTLGFGAELVVRVNPEIAVDAEVTGGSLNITKVPSLGKIRVTAGAATLEDVHIVSDCLVQAGSATVKGDIQSGRSRVKVESGSLGIHLGKNANVTISGEAQLGKINWPGEHGQVHEYVVGNGSAKLDIGVVMGLATVKIPDDAGDEQ